MPLGPFKGHDARSERGEDGFENLGENVASGVCARFELCVACHVLEILQGEGRNSLAKVWLPGSQGGFPEWNAVSSSRHR